MEHEQPEPPELTREQRADWAGRLFQKLATTRANAMEAGTDASAAEAEALRQYHQVMSENQITKSGEED